MKHVKNAVKVFVVSFLVIATGGAITKGALLGLEKFTAKALFKAAARMAAMTGLSQLVGGLMSKNMGAVGDNFGSKIAGRDAQAPRQLIYGRCRVGGTVTHLETAGTDNHKLRMIIVIAGHEIESLESIQINDETITSVAGTGANSGFRVVTNSKYTNTDNENDFGSGRLMRFVFKDGSQTTADSTITSNSSLGANDKFIDCAYLFVEMVFDSEAFGGGIPPFSFIVKGKKVFDPRDSNQTFGNSATHTFSTNPALHVLDYLKDTTYGLKATESELNLTGSTGNEFLGSFRQAANTCDTLNAVTTAVNNGAVNNSTTVNLTNQTNNLLIQVGHKVTGTGITGTVKVVSKLLTGSGGSTHQIVLDTPITINNTTTLSFGESAYTSNGFSNFSADGSALLEGILSSMAGKITYVNGKFCIFAGASGEADLTITDDNLLEPIQVVTKPNTGECYNTVKAIFPDANADFVATDTPVLTATNPSTSATYLSEDTPSGESQANYRKELELQLPFTETSTMAQRIAKTQLLHSRQDTTISMLCNINFLQLQPFDYVKVTNERLGFTNKNFEVISMALEIVETDGVPIAATRLDLKEIDNAVWTFAQSDYISPSPDVDLSSVSSGSFSVPAPTSPAVTLDKVNTGYDLKVTWSSAVDDNVQGTEILYGTSSGTYDSSVLAGKGSNKEIINNVKPDTTYFIVLRHFSSNNVFSDKTSEISIATGGADTPATISDLSRVQDKPFHIGLSWTNPNASDLREIRIHRATSSFTTGQATNSNLVRTIAAAPNVVQQASFGVEDGLTAGTTYYFRVVPVSYFNKVGTASNEVNGSFAKVAGTDIRTDTTIIAGSETNIAALDGTGKNAAGTVSISNNAVASVSITNGGSGYAVAPFVTISGNGVGATGTATVSNGAVTGVSITSGGSGYSSATISFEPVRIFAGKPLAQKNTAPFHVTQAGLVTAENATISGTVKTGQEINVGAGTRTVNISGSTGSQTILTAGSANLTDAPFRVLSDGTVELSKVNIFTTDGGQVFDSVTGFTGLGVTNIAQGLGTSTSDYTRVLTSTDVQKITLTNSDTSTSQDHTIVVKARFNGVLKGHTSSGNIDTAIAEIPNKIQMKLMQSTENSQSSGTQTELAALGGSFTTGASRVTSITNASQQFLIQTFSESDNFFTTNEAFTVVNQGRINASGQFEISSGNLTLTVPAGSSSKDFFFYIVIDGAVDNIPNSSPNATATAVLARPRTINITGESFFVDSTTGAGSDSSVGDITAVVAGTNLNGGGTSGSVTLNLDSTITGNHTFSNNLIVGGDLTVQGTTTTIDTTNLDVKDKNITLNFSTGNSSANANGAGITIQDAVSQGNDATILWDATNDEFDFSHKINAPTLAGTLSTAAQTNITSLGTLSALTVNGDITLTENDKIKTAESSGGSHLLLRSDNLGVTGNSLSLISLNDILIGAKSNQSGTGNIYFGYNAENKASGSGWVDTLTILESGNVGIGNTNPAASLHLTGSNVNIALEPTGTNAFFDNRKIGGATNFRVSGSSTNDTTALSINSSGNATFAGTISSGRHTITTVAPETTNTLLFLNANDQFSDILAADNGGSVVYRNDGGSFKLFVDGTANSSNTSNSQLALTIGANKNATFGGTISSGDITVNTNGRIGTAGGETFIAHNGTTDSGIRFRGSGEIIPATFAGTGSNGVTDLGAAGFKFRNLHLSGTISSGGITASGTHTFTANDVDFIVQDNTDSVTNFIWRDHSASKLYLGTADAVVNIRSNLDLNANSISNVAEVRTESLFIDSGGFSPSDVEGRHFKYYLVGQGTDQNFKKVADVTIGTGLFKALAMRVVIESQASNFGHVTLVNKSEFICSFVRSVSVQDDTDNATISGKNPPQHNLRIVKTATGTYELQVKQVNNFRDAILHIEILSTNGGSISITDGDVNGSTSGTVTTPTSSETAGATITANRFDCNFFNTGSFTTETIATTGTGNITSQQFLTVSPDGSNTMSMLHSSNNFTMKRLDNDGQIQFMNNDTTTPFVFDMTTASPVFTTTGTISSGDITIEEGVTPALTLSDTGNAGGGGASAKVIFKNTGGDAMGIGYTANVTVDSDMLISTNAGGTYGGYLGLDANGITDAKADIVLEPKTNVFIATGSLGVGQQLPTTNINTNSSFFRPDTSGKFVTINGGANGGFIMLESTTTTDSDQIGGLFWTRTAGQGDAHKQVAGIDAIQEVNSGASNLDGARLRFYTKPNNSGINTPRLQIDEAGKIYVGTTDILDQSRNLTNIGTVSSGAIATDTIGTTGTTDFNLRANNQTVVKIRGVGNADQYKVTFNDLFTLPNTLPPVNARGGKALRIAVDADINESAPYQLEWFNPNLYTSITATGSIQGRQFLIIEEAQTASNTVQFDLGKKLSTNPTVTDHDAVINMIGDNTHSTGGLIIKRNAGANNGSSITSKGTGDLTVDVGGDIILDADGADILFKDGGTQFGKISKGGGSDLIIDASIADKDIFFTGTDGSSLISALQLDMSNAGAATFNSTISSGAITSTGSSTFTSTGVMDINLVANPPELNFEDTSSTSGTKRARWTLDNNNFTAQGLSDNDGSVTQSLLNFSLSSGAATFGGTINSGVHTITNTGTSGNTRSFFIDAEDANYDFRSNSTSGYTTVFNMDNTGLEIGHDSSARNLALRTASTDRLTISGSGAFNFQNNSLAGIAGFSGTSTLNNGYDFNSTDSTANAAYTGMMIDHNASGSDTLDADRTHRALFIDQDSSASGGDTSNEHRLYGLQLSQDVTGDSDLVYGINLASRTAHTTGTVSALRGGNFVARHNSTSTTTQAIGVLGSGQISNAGTINSVYGGFFKSHILSTNTANRASAFGVYAEVENDSDTTLTNADGVRAVIDRDAGTITNGYLFRGSYEGTFPTNAFGVYISSNVQNYFAGDITIGNNTTDITGVNVHKADAQIAINDTNSNPRLRFRENGTTKSLIRTSSGSLIFTSGGTTTALTLDTSQNATFAGTISSGAITSSASITASGNSNNFGNTTIAALSATSGTFSASITASGNSNSFGNSSFGTISSGAITTTGHIQQNNANEIRSKDTGGTVRTIMRVNSSDELEYGWSGNGKVKIMGGGSYTERFSIGTDGNATFSGSISSGAITVNTADLTIEGGANASQKGLVIKHTGQTGNQTILEQNSTSAFGRLRTTERALRIEAGQGGGTGTSETLSFHTNGSRAMTIDTSQRVGIGTTSPQTELEISAAQSPFLRLTSEKNGDHDAGDIYGELQFFTQETFGNAPVVAAKIQSLHTRAGSGHSNGDAGLAFFTSLTSADATATERMRIESATGNVGIGTASPATKLDVVGNIASTGVATPEFELVPTGSVGNADIKFDGTSLDIRSNSSGAFLTLQTATTERLKITNTGNFEFNNGNLSEVGTINATGNLTVAKSTTPIVVFETSATSGQDATLKIRGARTSSNTSDIASIFFDNKTSSPYTLAKIIARDPSASHGSGNGQLRLQTSSGGTLSDNIICIQSNIKFATGGQNRAEITSAGVFNCANDVAAFGTLSDIRLKENIKVIENPLDKVKQIRGVNFSYKKDGRKSTGLIAQELEKVLPNAIFTTHELGDDKEIKAIRYGNVVGLLVEAIKEQQEQIEELKAKLEEVA